MELRSFLDGVDKLSETVFCLPTSKTELTQAAQKKRTETQKRIFNQLDDFLEFDAGVNYKEFKDKIGGIELSCLLRQSTQGQAPTCETPSSSK